MFFKAIKIIFRIFFVTCQIFIIFKRKFYANKLGKLFLYNVGVVVLLIIFTFSSIHLYFIGLTILRMNRE